MPSSSPKPQPRVSSARAPAPPPAATKCSGCDRRPGRGSSWSRVFAAMEVTNATSRQSRQGLPASQHLPKTLCPEPEHPCPAAPHPSTFPAPLHPAQTLALSPNTCSIQRALPAPSSCPVPAAPAWLLPRAPTPHPATLPAPSQGPQTPAPCPNPRALSPNACTQPKPLPRAQGPAPCCTPWEDAENWGKSAEMFQAGAKDQGLRENWSRFGANGRGLGQQSVVIWGQTVNIWGKTG